MLINDSCFAKGLGLVVSKVPVEPIPMGINDRAFDVLKYLDESEGLTLSVIAQLLECSRKMANKTVVSLSRSSMVRCITVAAQQDLFKLWVTSSKKPLKNANEACRLAALGLYYGRAKKEVPGFEWQVIRNPKKLIHAEMTYTTKDSKEKAKLIIDAPRRGEEPSIDADILIFPTLEEGKLQVPKGKRFTSDVTILLEKNVELSKLIYELN